MSCISSNFSSFFLNSLNDPSEFAKYLSNGELKFSNFEDIQVFGTQQQQQQQQLQHQHQQSQYSSSQQQLQQNGNVAFYNGASSSIVNNNNVNSNNSNSSTNNRGAIVEHNVGLTAGGQNNAEIYNNAAHMETNNYSHQSPATHHQQPQQVPQQQQQQHHPASQQQQQQHYVHGHPQPQSTVSGSFHNNQHIGTNAASAHHSLPTATNQTTPQGYNPAQRWASIANSNSTPTIIQPQQQQQTNHAIATNAHHTHQPTTNGAQHFDGSFEFLKYLRHSNDYSESSNDTSSNNAPATNTNSANNSQQNATAANSLIDLDSSTTQKSRSSRKVAALLSSVSRASNSLDSSNTLDDVFDHDSKHTIFDLHHVTNSSNSNEMDVSNLAYPNSHLNASNSNTSSEGAAAGSNDFTVINSASNAPKPLATFTIKDNFDVHPSHKIEEGIFQHMNKLPSKKKENLKQLGVRFTGQMNLYDKSIVVENFIKFCQEYDIKDHRPFLSLNQSGLNKPEQIKFARYLGQGLPTFTLFCIYSNFKNLFCTKRTEIYIKDGYNLPYILEKTKRFLSNTTADLKNMIHQQSNDGLDFIAMGNNSTSLGNIDQLPKCVIVPRPLDNLVIYENFDVHETHRVEDGVCTHITRLPPKKQELFKQFGIQNNQTVTYYEKYIIIENFIKFCNEYKITDHRPFLDFHESGFPKCEQLKFVRYMGQGLPNLTLNKIYLTFKDVLACSRLDKITPEGYNLDVLLKKKKKNVYNRMHAAVHKESTETARQGHLMFNT